MNRIENVCRVRRLIERAILSFQLNLDGLSVLTEAASGAFVVTPLIAAIAGSKRVIAATRNSRHGSAAEVLEYASEWARRLGVADRIEFTSNPASSFAGEADIVTNLGHIRPIDASFIQRMRPGAVIPLMFETWECRASDVDLDACATHGVPVLGTNERDARLRTFDFVGALALKLLFEAGIEVFQSRVVVIGSDPFGEATAKFLAANEAQVTRLCPLTHWNPKSPSVRAALRECDAVVVVEHRANCPLIGDEQGIPLDMIRDSGAVVVHVCGAVDAAKLTEHGVLKFPSHDVPPGWMTLTTDYVGPKPVIDLHAAGLRVGETLAKGMQQFGSIADATAYAKLHAPSMDFTSELFSHAS